MLIFFCDCVFFPLNVVNFFQSHIQTFSFHTISDPLDAMSDLACVKEIIEALPPESKKELFKYFITLNDSANGANCPTTPITASEPWSSASKRPLSSPESPQRNKKDGQVSPHSI